MYCNGVEQSHLSLGAAYTDYHCKYTYKDHQFHYEG